MEKKNILVVSGAFYPDNSPRSFRTTELVKEFAKLGHNVTVYITKDKKEHVEFEKNHRIKINNLGTRRFKEINFRTGSKLEIFLRRGFRRVLVQLFEYPDIELMYRVYKAMRKERNFDLLISVAVPFPIHWGVAWARNKDHQIAKKWVADCGDPYYFSSHDTFKKLPYFQFLEKWFCKKADYISIPFEGLKKYFFEDYRSKFRVIPQGFNFDDIEISRLPVKNDTITFAYAGGFMKNSRDPRLFIDFLKKIKIPFKFVVYNNQKEFGAILKEKLDNKVVLKKYIPRDKLLFELSKMDFLVNFEFDPTNQAPSKLIDYSLTRRPILMIKNEQFDENIIIEFLNKDYTHQFLYPDIDAYNIKNVARQFLNLSE